MRFIEARELEQVAGAARRKKPTVPNKDLSYQRIFVIGLWYSQSELAKLSLRENESLKPETEGCQQSCWLTPSYDVELAPGQCCDRPAESFSPPRFTNRGAGYFSRLYALDVNHEETVCSLHGPFLLLIS